MSAYAIENRNRLSRLIVLGVVLAFVIIAGVVAYRGQQQNEATAKATALLKLPASALEEKYGLRINLIAITAAGGLVDVRYKVLDLEKFTQWVQGTEQYPDLEVYESSVILHHPADAQWAISNLKIGDVINALYPNNSSALKPGAGVWVSIGNERYGPFNAQQ